MGTALSLCMSKKQVINEKIEAAAGRRKIQAGWRGMWLGLWVGGCLWLVTIATYKLLPISTAMVFGLVIVGLSFPVIGLALGLAKRFAARDTARWLDQETGLKERLSTAVELTETEAKGSEWSALVIRDAAQAADEIEPRRLLPLRLPALCSWTLLLLIACFALGFVPEHRSKAYLDQQRDTAIIEDVGTNLENLTKWQVKENQPQFDPTEEVLESVEKLGREFQKGELPRDEALAKLTSLAEQLRDEAKKLDQAQTINKLQQAARTPAGTAAPSPEEMQKQMAELEEGLGDAKDAKPEQFDEIKSKLDAIKEAAVGLPDANTPEGKQAQQELAQSLADLANMAQQMGLEMPDLDKAIEALKGSDIDQFLKNMEFSAQELEKMAELSKALQNLEMQMAEVGKDLAEQLEKGQVPAALSTLEKMMSQLDSSQLSAEELEKMIEELQEALDPAESYGECSKSLSDAKDQAKAGDKSGASKSLAKAKDELKNLLKEMADAQNLMQALGNLERAQMAVGNCQSFSVCRKPGAGPSSRPGAGVGMWGDDSLQMTPDQMTQRMDNSGFNRPDVDPRGITERGNKVPDNMVASRIKGQIDPKGQMPSITLRGVSITGNSKVQFQEAVSAAQSDARNALNQDKVPRAYRDSVRDYFDDLKE